MMLFVVLRYNYLFSELNKFSLHFHHPTQKSQASSTSASRCLGFPSQLSWQQQVSVCCPSPRSSSKFARILIFSRRITWIVRCVSAACAPHSTTPGRC